MQRLCYYMPLCMLDNRAASLLSIIFDSATTKNLAGRHISQLMCQTQNQDTFFHPCYSHSWVKQSRTCMIKAHISYFNDITICLPTSNQLSMVLNVDLARTVVDSVLDLARTITCVALPVLLGLMQENPTIISDLRLSKRSFRKSKQHSVHSANNKSCDVEAQVTRLKQQHFR